MSICLTIGFLGLAIASTPAGLSSPEGMRSLAKDPPKAILSSLSTGAKSSSDVLHLAVSLSYRDSAGMKQFVDSVSDPKNPNYRHFLTPDQIGQRFGLPSNEIAKVSDYLKSMGMNVTLVSKNRLSILADATVAQAQAAFNISIEEFKTAPTRANDDGRRFSFTTPPQLPNGIAVNVIDIGGLENFTRPKPKSLSPANLQGLYGLAPLYKKGSQGQGRTIGISNWDGFRISNEVLECTAANLPVPSAGAGTNISIVPIDGGTGGAGYEYGEGDLDIQASIAMAPLCNLIIYDNYLDSGTSNLIDLLTKEAEDNNADVITESYGWTLDIPTSLAAHNQHLSMSGQGITYLAASGDTGTTYGGYNYPNIDPDVLMVGGTSASVNSANQRATEVGWNSDGGAGGGGWAATGDTFNVRPAYQSTPTFLAQPSAPSLTSVPYRLSPDVALNADPNTGYIVQFSTGPAVIGGTSGASPTCAGGLSDAEQQLVADGYLPADGFGHSRMGRIADLLYSYNGAPAVFYDITSGTNGLLPNGQTSNATAGWDFDSGWGALEFSGLVARIEGIPEVDGLKLSGSIINGGTTLSAVVTLSTAATEGGVSVSLNSSGGDLIAPPSLLIPAGSSSATFQVATNGVTAEESLYLTASNALGVASANVLLFPANYSAISAAPSPVPGGVTATGTVTLLGNAPASGYVIYLSSSSGLATVPGTVTVPANANSVNFPIKTSSVSKSTSVTITGTAGNSKTLSVAIALQPSAVQSVSLSSSSVVGGSANPITGTVTLDGPAGPAGATVSLSSSNTKLASVLSSVRIPAGSASATFTVNHALTSSSGTIKIAAKLNSLSQSATLQVDPFVIIGLTLTPSSAIGGSSVAGKAALNAAPGTRSGALAVRLTSSITGSGVPASLEIPVGASSAQFTFKAKAVAVQTQDTITASYKTSSQSVTLTISPSVLASVTVSPSSVVGSASTKVTGTLTLTGPAPTGGLVVKLSTSSPSAASVPASVTIAAGKTTATFTVTHKKVSSTVSATITGTASGISQSASVTVNAG